MTISAGLRRKSVCGPDCADIVAMKGNDIHYALCAKVVRLLKSPTAPGARGGFRSARVAFKAPVKLKLSPRFSGKVFFQRISFCALQRLRQFRVPLIVR